jgi:hypothetical protein
MQDAWSKCFTALLPLEMMECDVLNAIVIGRDDDSFGFRHVQ